MQEKPPPTRPPEGERQKYSLRESGHSSRESRSGGAHVATHRDTCATCESYRPDHAHKWIQGRVCVCTRVVSVPMNHAVVVNSATV